jgi:hypothetical protein
LAKARTFQGWRSAVITAIEYGASRRPGERSGTKDTWAIAAALPWYRPYLPYLAAPAPPPTYSCNRPLPSMLTLRPSRMPMQAALLAVVLLLSASFLTPERTEQARFQILKGNKVIGLVHAMKQQVGVHTNYVMTSHAEFSVVWKQTVQTRLLTEYRNGELSACRSAIAVNDALRDSSLMVRGSDQCYVYPELAFTCERATQWTTARMYFEEPLMEDLIFVESALRDLALDRLGEGQYLLTFPNGNYNRYVYRSGVLQEIHVKRPLVNLVFRRT